MNFIPFLLNLVIIVAVIGIIIMIFQYAMSKFGIGVDGALMKIVYAIFGLAFLIWFVDAVLALLGHPRLWITH